MATASSIFFIKNPDSSFWTLKKKRIFCLTLTIISGMAAIFALLFMILFIYVPNQGYMRQKQKTCIIEKAQRACYTKKSNKLVDGKGPYHCWHFTVRYENKTAFTEYNQMDDFPAEHDGCDSESSCGMELWPCRVDPQSSSVAMNWKFPVGATVCYSVGVLFLTMISIFSGWSLSRIGRYWDENERNWFDMEKNDAAHPSNVAKKKVGGGIFGRRNAAKEESPDVQSPNDGSTNTKEPNKTSPTDTYAKFSDHAVRKRKPTWMKSNHLITDLDVEEAITAVVSSKVSESFLERRKDKAASLNENEGSYVKKGND